MKLKEYLDLLDTWEILRRYFVMNGFDGALTAFGILLGAFLIGTMDGKEIIYSVLGGGIAMFVSGFWGAYIVEFSERKREIKNLSKKMLKDLEKTEYGKAMYLSSIIAGIVDGISPLIFSFISLMPVILHEYLNLFSLEFSLQASIIISLIQLYLLGVYLGKVSRENPILFGSKMLFAAILVIIIMVLFGSFA